jgi:2-polyprenyl-6-methoxyphenol hydroxylase-like FAD-dependent oxidoreductase
MFGKKKPDVLIVGAGPVGLVAAITLARRGVQVRIIDEAWRSKRHAYGLALHPDSMKLLQELGVIEPILKEAYRVTSLGLYDGGERRGQLDLAALDKSFPFVAVLPQSVLEKLLTELLTKHQVEVQWNHRLSRIEPADNHVQVIIDKLQTEAAGYAISRHECVVGTSKEYKVPFVIGADGHRSLVRRQLKLDFPEVGRAQHFAVFEFSTDFDLNHEMRVVLNATNANVIWPLPGGRCRWSFELPDYDYPSRAEKKSPLLVEFGGAHYPMLEESNLRSLLAERVPWFSGNVGGINWALVVRFERRLVESFGANRAWLVGDSAHQASPIGVQSLNVGMREAHELATLVADELEGKPDVRERLQEFGQQRLVEWRKIFGIEGGLSPSAVTPEWLRPYAGDLVSALPGSGPGLDLLVGQIGLAG